MMDWHEVMSLLHGSEAAVLAWLRTFCEVVEAGGVSQAAARLHLSQPAVTRQLQALERELGGPLLRRGRRGTAPTPLGEAVYRHAVRALREAEACRRVAERWRAESGGNLVLGAGLTLVLFTLPPVIARYRAQHPDVRLRVVTGTSEEIADQLLEYRVDVAVATSPPPRPGVRATPLFRDPLVLAVAPSHPLAGAGAARLADLAGQPLLAPGPGSGLRRELEEVLRRRGVAAAAVMEFDSLEAIKTMVALDLGVAVLPLSAVRDDVAAGRLRTVTLADWPPPGGRTVTLLERDDPYAPAPARAFAALARSMLAEDAAAPVTPAPRAARGRRSG